jgi:SNF2 family DNA or RNA helicase
MNPKAYEPEVADLRTPADQQAERTFRSTPFGTPTSRSRARPTPTPKRDTEKDIRNLMASIGDDTDENQLTEEERKDPDGLTVTLMEHQKRGVAWMRKQELGTYHGGILADDVSLAFIKLMLMLHLLTRKMV